MASWLAQPRLDEATVKRLEKCRDTLAAKNRPFTPKLDDGDLRLWRLFILSRSANPGGDVKWVPGGGAA